MRRSAWEEDREPLGRELCFCAFSTAPSTPSAADQGRSTSPGRCACGANKAPIKAALTNSGRCARQGSPAARTGYYLQFEEASGPATPQATFRFAKTELPSPFGCWLGAAASRISANRGPFLRASDCLDAGKSGRDLLLSTLASGIAFGFVRGTGTRPTRAKTALSARSCSAETGTVFLSVLTRPFLSREAQVCSRHFRC